MNKDTSVLVHYKNSNNLPKQIDLRYILSISGKESKEPYVIITKKEYEALKNNLFIDRICHNCGCSC